MTFLPEFPATSQIPFSPFVSQRYHWVPPPQRGLENFFESLICSSTRHRPTPRWHPLSRTGVRRIKKIKEPLWVYLLCTGRDLRAASLSDSDEMNAAADSPETGQTLGFALAKAKGLVSGLARCAYPLSRSCVLPIFRRAWGSLCGAICQHAAVFDLLHIGVRGIGGQP